MTQAFEWDPIKNESSKLKHRIDFQDAQRIFDNSVLAYKASLSECGEERFIAIGYLEDSLVLVVYIWRSTCRRLISARPAHTKERKAYHDFWQNRLGTIARHER